MEKTEDSFVETVYSKMKKQHGFRKMTSGFLALLMIAALFASWPITVSAARAEDHTVGAYEIRNDYLRVSVNGDCHVLYTTGGDPNSNTDDNKKLLYDCTSCVFLNINGDLYRYDCDDGDKSTAQGDSLYSSMIIDGIKIERYISFAYNIYTSRHDTVEYRYVMTNQSENDANVGTRIFFDTMLGNNDSAPFRVNGQNVTYGKEFVGDDVPQTWQVFDRFDSPTVVASGTFYYDEADRPDRVQFLNYHNGISQVWDCNYSGYIGDSAVNVYYNPISLAPGESRTVKTYYGLSAFIPSEEPEETDPVDPEPDDSDPDETTPVEPDPILDFDFTAMAPADLIVNETEDGYVGNPFTFNGWVNNNGDLTLRNVSLTIQLPEGLTLLNDSAVTFLNIEPGVDKGVIWRIRAENAASDVTYRYTVTVTAEGMDPRTYTYNVNVPQLVHRHNYVEGEGRTPTCDQPGYTRYECSDCGDVVDAYIPPVSHSYTAEVVAEATCTTPGMVRYTCIHCGDSYMNYVYSEHRYELIEHKDALCTQDGYNRFGCRACGDSYEEIIPGGHSYEAEVTRVATETEEGLITYTCSICGDTYTEVIPVRQAASILLVQDRLPWTENINTVLLDSLLDDGYIVGWDMITTRELASVELSLYDVIYIANDQSTDTYNRLKNVSDRITAFAEDGGVVVYGACDHGWASGDISYALPGGVTIENYYSNRNYIANPHHYVVTGALTDRKPISNELLYSTYSSHTYFTNLPDGTVSILEDANGRPTLVEYPVGNGYVIASGLTWEYTYVRDFVNGTSFAQNVYDDLLVYAMTLSDPCPHAYDEGIVVDPTCEEDGYTLHTCLKCGRTLKDQIRGATGHTEGEWTVVHEATETENGLKRLACLVCNDVLAEEVIPMINGPVIRVEADTDTVLAGEQITFYVKVENCGPISALAIVPTFDRDVFELVNLSWKVSALLQNIEENTLRAISAWSEPTDVNTTVFAMTLMAKAPTALTAVGCEFTVQDATGTHTYPVVGKTVSVVSCPHSEMAMETVNDTHHASVCTRCGYSILSAHEFEHACDTSCDICGFTREITHEYGEEWSYDTNRHWRICSVCGECGEYGDHVYDSLCDSTCNECGEVREAPHLYHEECEFDDTGHWISCELCGNEIGHEEHSYEDDYDMQCEGCLYERYVAGDANRNGILDPDDALYVVYYVLFGEESYPSDQPFDYDGNGTVNSDDAVHLLYSFMFGEEEYPLSIHR